jgi:hypothetical protein
MGLQGVVIFIGSLVDDVTYVRDVEVCMYSMICYISGWICYGSENFVLGSAWWLRWTCWRNPTVLFRSSISVWLPLCGWVICFVSIDGIYFLSTSWSLLFLSRYFFFFCRCVLSNLTRNRSVVHRHFTAAVWRNDSLVDVDCRAVTFPDGKGCVRWLGFVRVTG